MVEIKRLSAFVPAEDASGAGGNPAGVLLLDAALPADEMQAIAADVNYSETAFAVRGKSDTDWQVRYFSPENEVPFCGHATIALGGALTDAYGENIFQLTLNEGAISVEGHREDGQIVAALQSPPTKSRLLTHGEIEEGLALFGLDQDHLEMALNPAHIHAGADHWVFALNDRTRLAAMDYDLDEGRAFMLAHGLVTIMLVFIEDPHTFHVRNAFASGGVWEDPATGAAAAAFSGRLRDVDWPHGGAITLYQGEDMGRPSVIKTEITDEISASIRVSGRVRNISV